MERKQLMHITNLVMLAAFVLSALVQFNDPDALFWILIYGAAAACCLLHMLGRPVTIAAGTIALIALAWAIALLPRVLGEADISAVFASLTMQTRAVEEAREIGGLLLTGGWMLVLWRGWAAP